MKLRSLHLLVALCWCATSLSSQAVADYFATANDGFIYRFKRDGNTFQQSQFVDLGPGQLSGLVYSPSENVMYASKLSTAQIFRIDMVGGLQSISVGDVSGNPAFPSVGIAPSGLAIDSTGKLHVAAFADSNIATGQIYGAYQLNGPSFLESALTPVASTFTGPMPMFNGGIGFLADDSIVVSAAVKEVGAAGLIFGGANAQVAIAPNGQSYFVGSTQLDTADTNSELSNIYRFETIGATPTAISISDALLGGATYLGTPSNPAGVAFDGDGNLIVTAMGSSPFADPKGALFLFDPNNFSDPLASWSGELALSNVIYVPTAVPEPSALLLCAFGGLGGAVRRWRIKGKNE